MEQSAKTPKRWMVRLLQLAIAGAALTGIISMQRAQLSQTSLEIETPEQVTRQEALRLQLLQKAPTFGFDNLVADWVFLSFLQYYGDEAARAKTDYSLSPQYFDLITQRDPRFVDIYLFLSGVISYELGQPQLAIAYMKRGTDALSPQIDPRAFTIWQYQALDQLLLLGDTTGAIQSLEMAAKWAEAVPENREVVPYFQKTAEFLKADPDSKLIRFQSWGAIYERARATGDRKTQERAKQEILALGGVEKVDSQGRRYFSLYAPPKAASQQPSQPQ